MTLYIFCRSLTEKYFIMYIYLQSVIEKRLNYYFKNQNRKLNKKSKNKENELDNSDISNTLQIMSQEMGKENINRNLIKKILNETRNARNLDAIKLNAHDLVQKYRGLLDEDFVIIFFLFQLVF